MAEAVALVRNVVGEYEVPAGYDSWLEYWKVHKPDLEAEVCCQIHCDRTDIEGCHVYHDGHPETVFLIPLCKGHNHYTNTSAMFVLSDYLLLVPEELLVKKEE
ncbi:MAG: hypothetical protein IJ604_05530 [Prevotella sp.]|nr:hypothetical protein [Prevotella sp.]MBR1462825.1 hypothetical protein [Prevotella sp.]